MDLTVFTKFLLSKGKSYDVNGCCFNLFQINTENWLSSEFFGGTLGVPPTISY